MHSCFRSPPEITLTNAPHIIVTWHLISCIYQNVPFRQSNTVLIFTYVLTLSKQVGSTRNACAIQVSENKN